MGHWNDLFPLPQNEKEVWDDSQPYTSGERPSR